MDLPRGVFAGLTAFLALLVLDGCPLGEDSGVLGLPCECADGSARCDTADICDDLSCVDGLCSSECDLALQDCPGEFYCTPVSSALAGSWCRPMPMCVSKAGRDEESLLMARAAPIGAPCVAPAFGEGTIEGAVFGVSFPTESQRALFSDLDPDSTFGTMIHIGVGIEVSEVSGQCTTRLGDVALRVTLPCGALRLGTYDIGVPLDEDDPVTAEVLTPTDEGVAVEGTVTLDGFDPNAGTLCGSVDVSFNDGNEGRLLGVFEAEALCR